MKRLLIDTDTATDDALALLIALKCEFAKVEAITIVAGNVDFEQEVENALYTLELSGVNYYVPVFKGCRRPLLRNLVKAEEVHGKDGMGESYFPKAKQRAEDLNALQALLDYSKRFEGELIIVALGPLTNLALASILDPNFPKRIKELYVMGGAVEAKGNITPVSEYNFFVDPEAAKIVLNSNFNLTLVDWNLCLKYGIIREEEYKEIVNLNTKGSDFYFKINRVVKEYSKKMGLEGLTHPDALAMCVALYPDIVKKKELKYVEVDLCEGLSRGMSIVDHNNILGKKGNAYICYEVDGKRFKDILMDTLRRIK